MKTITFKQTGQAVRAFWRSARWWVAGLLVGFAGLAGAPAQVVTLAGFDAGYANGNSQTTALFNRPVGIALNTTNTILYVADQNNNAVREMLLAASPPTTLTFTTAKINQPVGVLVDATNNVYVLNRGNGANGSIIWFNKYGNLIGPNNGTLATNLVGATAFAMDGLGNLYVTESNRVVKFSLNGLPSTNVTITSAIITDTTNSTSSISHSVSLQGITVLGNGLLAVTDGANHGIWLVNPATQTFSQFTGFNGVGTTPGIAADAQFFQPEGIAYAGDGILVVSDYGNDRVVTVDPFGTVQVLYGIPPADWDSGEERPGSYDGNACDNDYDNCAESCHPYGVTVAQDGDVFTTEIFYDLIRQTTGTGFAGPGTTPGVTPLFNGPQGIALDGSGAGLYIADQANNAVELLNFGNNTTTTFLYPSNGISRPADVAFDNFDNLYVLNQGTNANDGSILEFNEFGKSLGVIATNLSLPTALTIDPFGDIFVADQNGAVQEFSGGVSNTIATITTPGVSLQGIALFSDGTIAVSDAGNDVLWQINPVGDTVSLLSGGVGQPGSGLGQFNQPHQLVLAGGNQLLVSDSGNNRIVAVQSSGVVTNVLISTNSEIWFGRIGDPVPASSAQWVPMVAPLGVAVGPNGTVYDSEDVGNDIRGILATGFTEPPAPAPAPAPVIGEVVFADTNNNLTTFITTSNASFIFNNTNGTIAIEGNGASQIFYNFSSTANAANIPNPATNGSSAPSYINGQSFMPAPIIGIAPDQTIKAVGVNPGSPDSPVVEARIQYVTANPQIIGNNAAQFSVFDNTPGALMWYTTDGSTPTNGPPSLGPVTNGATLFLNIASNTVFNVQAFNTGFAPSGVASTEFFIANFIANSITFGFASGEASSAFLASPGQFFYAPVTLSVLPGTLMDSLQFEMSVTNLINLPGTNSPPVGLGQIGFQSMLVQPDPSNATIYFTIPPAMTVTNALLTGFYTEPPPGNLLFTNSSGVVFVDAAITNSTDNQLDIGWLERAGQGYLYNTLSQDLIQYSVAHDDVFLQSQGGQVIVGGFGFRVPTNSVAGSTYVIQLSRPSATTDGIGNPGSAVYISTPTNGALGAGAINSIKYVTIGPTNYIAGDSAPFRWFNEGDFGNRLLDISDVGQVFQTAIYALNAPPAGSDFFDSMDSCCRPAITNAAGYLVPAPPGAFNADALYYGDDSSIDLYPFGDGKLDVTDVYVTFRRCFSGPMWFERFWTVNGLAATNVPNVYTNSGGSTDGQGSFYVLSESNPAVAFYAGDAQGSSGQTLTIPITARTEGSYPLRVLMLNLTVYPLEGSPAITAQVQFTPDAALGQPSYVPTAFSGPNNYSAAWLNSDIPGLSTNATIGTLTVTLPAGAGPLSSYAVRFDHASGSPNGLASFPVTANTGVITLSDRSSSHFNDGIPDVWRLRHFGTVSNVLSMASADADGDGANNWNEYEAGTDPNDAQSVFRAAIDSGTNKPECVLQWPTAVGIQYIIQKSSSLYGTNWTTLTTNAGTGWNLQFHDTTPGTGPRFYRVQAVP